MRVLKIIAHTITFLLLTVVTQIGGVVYLLSFFSHRFIDDKVRLKATRLSLKVAAFLFVYLLFTLLVVPIVAKSFGRVQLPVWEQNGLKPANILTAFLNRNYVRPQLKEAVAKTALQLSLKYPGTKVNYLDGSFPFFNKFRLLPHLGHSDGRKLDISFQYDDSQSGKISTDVPSFIGYGICEEPEKGEEDRPAQCEQSGAWQYNFLKKLVSQESKRNFKFNNSRNRDMVNFFASQRVIATIFIEPHLQSRLGLTTQKIRFHGCRAVRHDDHLHVQIDW